MKPQIMMGEFVFIAAGGSVLHQASLSLQCVRERGVGHGCGFADCGKFQGQPDCEDLRDLLRPGEEYAEALACFELDESHFFQAQ